MTREEAIKQLKIELSMWESDCKSYHKTKDALKMAIKALEKETVLEGATNGDMIMAMFPHAKVNNNKYTYCVEVKLEYHSKYDTGLLFDKDWWNAPYKREVKK